MADETFCDILYRVLVRTVLVIGLVVFFGGRCSTSGAGALRAEQINSGLNSATATLDELEVKIDRSSATPEEKSAMKSSVRSAKKSVAEAKPAVTALGKDADTFQSQAQKNAVDAGRMRLLYWIAGIIAALGLAYLFKGRILKWFTPMVNRSD